MGGRRGLADQKKAQGAVIGIDLGTTNSVVAVMEGKNQRVRLTSSPDDDDEGDDDVPPCR